MSLTPLPLPTYQPEKEPEVPPLHAELAWVVDAIFLFIALLFYMLGLSAAWKPLVDNISINFLAILVEALPFMLIGSLAGGIIEVFISVQWVERIVHKRSTGMVFLAGILGLAIPVCECAIVPVVRRLLGKGVPFGVAVTFLLAGPIVNPIVAASTAVAYSYDWIVVATRMFSGYSIAVAVGLLLGRLFRGSPPLVAGNCNTSSCGCGAEHDVGRRSLFSRLYHSIEHATDDFFDVGRYLVIGAFIAAIMRSIVPMESFIALQESPWQAILLMMLLALLLNLCSEADAFIAASFRSLLPGSAQMAFMVMGPMLDIKLILMYFSVFQRKAIIALIVSVSTAVFLVMLALHYWLPTGMLP